MADNRLYEVARLYHLEGETMEAIAKRVNVSRSTVSRMLATARETGLVRVSLAPGHSATDALARDIGELFEVRAHVVAEAQGELRRLDAVARVAARLLGEWVEPGFVVGVAWGTTISAVVSHLEPHPLTGVTVVQLNGAANQATSGIPFAGSIMTGMAEAFRAAATFFPVPAFFDHPETRRAMWRERSIQRVLDVQRRCDLAVFGVGSIRGSLRSHVYTAGYLDADDLAALSFQGVVGDVCTVLLREDGTWEDIDLNARATGPTPAELRRIARRVCVVAGDAKVAPTLGALRAGAVTDLVIDETTARGLLAAAR
ncbi:MAG: sugar-binding transcriptional regulator [Actinomycetota bacterium]